MGSFLSSQSAGRGPSVPGAAAGVAAAAGFPGSGAVDPVGAAGRQKTIFMWLPPGEPDARNSFTRSYKHLTQTNIFHFIKAEYLTYN